MLETVSIYFTKEEIIEFIRNKIAEEHQDKIIELSNVYWNKIYDGSVTLDFILSHDKSEIDEHIGNIDYSLCSD